MNIGFDAKRAVQNNTGLGNYSRYVIEVLSGYFPDNNYTLFAPKRKENPRLKLILSRKNITFLFPSAGIFRFFPSLWRTCGVKSDIKRLKIDIFHGLSNEIPLGLRQTGVKTVVTIHDLIFLRYPQYYKWIDRLIYRLKFKYASAKADKVIAVSECTKRDIVSFFGTPAEKIVVVYQGCHPNFATEVPSSAKETVRNKYGLPGIFLLYVGSIEPRKNLLLAVKSLTGIPENVHLVAIGKSTPYQQKVIKHATEAGTLPRLHILNQVPFDDLPAIYQMASIFIYPSFFEGFGIPIIEALSCKVPVIAATGSCLEEAGGPDSIYVDPTNDKLLAEKIQTVLADEMLAQTMITKGREYVERFSEKKIAEDMMQVYSSLLSYKYEQS